MMTEQDMIEAGIPASCEDCEHYEDCDLIGCRIMEAWLESKRNPPIRSDIIEVCESSGCMWLDKLEGAKEHSHLLTREELKDKLGDKYTAKVVGFRIVLREGK